jgi:DNA-binding beta-propeller fold protein YncE
MRRFQFFIALLAALMPLAALVPLHDANAQVPAAVALPYRIVNTVFLGSPEQWDSVYYDAMTGHVFIAHGTEITVVDGDSGAMLGRVAGFAGAHGLVTIPERGLGYAVSRDAHALEAFDLKSLEIVKSIPVSSQPDSLALDPVTNRILVTDAEQPIATIVSPSDGSAWKTVQLGGGAEQAIADGRGRVFINIADKREIVRLDMRTARIDARWKISSCESPHGVAMDTKSQRLFVSCANSLLVVVNASNGQVVTSLPIGKGTDGCEFDTRRRRVLSSNGWDGTLSVITQDRDGRYRSVAEVPTAKFGRTMALNHDTGRIYIAAADLERMDPTAPNKWAQYVMKPGSVRLIFLDPVD